MYVHEAQDSMDARAAHAGNRCHTIQRRRCYACRAARSAAPLRAFVVTRLKYICKYGRKNLSCPPVRRLPIFFSFCRQWLSGQHVDRQAGSRRTHQACLPVCHHAVLSPKCFSCFFSVPKRVLFLLNVGKRHDSHAMFTYTGSITIHARLAAFCLFMPPCVTNA